EVIQREISRVLVLNLSGKNCGADATHRIGVFLTTLSLSSRNTPRKARRVGHLKFMCALFKIMPGPPGTLNADGRSMWAVDTKLHWMTQSPRFGWPPAPNVLKLMISR